MIEHNDVKYFKLAVGSDRIGRETATDISARCPVCGDSAKKKSSKRLHIYNKNNKTRINCFNGDCTVNNKTMYSFLRDFFPSLFEQYKRDNFSNSISNLKSFNSSVSDSGDVFANISIDSKTNLQKEPTVSEVVTQDLSPYLKNINEVQEALNYLQSRGFSYAEQYGKWYFGYQDLIIGETTYYITTSIVIPLYYNNEMYGFYSRSIKDKTFYTRMSDANIGYKIWNWFNIDKSKAVYIFEGIFDAISSGLDNVIALIGAKIPRERLSELDNAVFVLDNDKTGLVNSLEYAKLGHNVYVQPDMYKEKDMNELLLNNPAVNIPNMIKENISAGILAEVKIKSKL